MDSILDVYITDPPKNVNTFGLVPHRTDRLYIKWPKSPPEKNDILFADIVAQTGSTEHAYKVLYTLIQKFGPISVHGQFDLKSISQLFFWLGKSIPPLTIIADDVEKGVYFTFCHKFYNGNSYTYCNSSNVIVISPDISTYNTLFAKETHYNGHTKPYLLQEDIAKYGHNLVKRYVRTLTKHVSKTITPELHQITAPFGINKSIYTSTLQNFAIFDVNYLVHAFELHPSIAQVVTKIKQNIDEYKSRLNGDAIFIEQVLSTAKCRALEVFRTDNYVVLSEILAHHVRNLIGDYNVCVDRIVNLPSYNVYMHSTAKSCYLNQAHYSWRMLDYYSIVEQIEDMDYAMMYSITPDLLFENGDRVGVVDGLTTFYPELFGSIVMANLWGTYLAITLVVIGIICVLYYLYAIYKKPPLHTSKT